MQEKCQAAAIGSNEHLRAVGMYRALVVAVAYPHVHRNRRLLFASGLKTRERRRKLCVHLPLRAIYDFKFSVYALLVNAEKAKVYGQSQAGSVSFFGSSSDLDYLQV